MLLQMIWTIQSYKHLEKYLTMCFCPSQNLNVVKENPAVAWEQLTS